MPDEAASSKQLSATEPRMDDMNPEQSASRPLVLSPQQKVVLESLQERENQNYPLSQWYLGALYALENRLNPDRISQAAQSLRELVEKLPRVVKEAEIAVNVGSFDFKGTRSALLAWFSKVQKRYNGEWKGKTIDPQLEKTLKKLEQYLKATQQPSRAEQLQAALTRIDPMLNSIDQEILQQKIRAFRELWEQLEAFAHHKSAPTEGAFISCVERVEKTIIDLLAPITAQDQQEILRILGIPQPSAADVEKMLELIARRGANYAFFFSKVDDPIWIPILQEKGFFKNPPGSVPTGETGVTFPIWRPILFLTRMAPKAPEKVVEIVAGFKKIENPRVLHEIAEIALSVSSIPLSISLKPQVIEYIKSAYSWGAYNLI